MAVAATELRTTGGFEEDDDEQQHADLVGCFGTVTRDASKQRRASRLAVEGRLDQLQADDNKDGGRGRASAVVPPPHAWLAIDEDTARKSYDSDTEEKWARLLRGGGGRPGSRLKQQEQRRSSFSVVRRERAAREACLDRAWEMKRSWHARNGGVPDADTPVVVVVGKGPEMSSESPLAGAGGGVVGGGGVAMDVEEVQACRDLGLELPSDCTVEVQCFGLSGGSSPTDTASSGGGSDSPGSIPTTHGADPMDVKARLKVWAHAVALASTTHLGSTHE